MPVLPTRDNLGGLPSLRPPGGVAQPDTTGVGRGLASFGGAVADLGAVLQATWKDAKKAEADSKFLQFQYDENKRLDEFKRGLKPEEAEGASQRFMGGFIARSKGLLDSFDPSIRAQYGDKVFVFHDSLLNGEGGALAAERAGQQLFIGNTYDNTLNNTFLPRAMDAGAKANPKNLDQILAENAAHIATLLLSEVEEFKLLSKSEVDIRKRFGASLPPEMREKLLLDDAVGGMSSTMTNVPFDDVLSIVESADAEIEKQQEEFRDNLSKDFQEKADAHTLTVDEVEDMRDLMSAEQYAKFHRLATDEGEEPEISNELYRELVTMSRESPAEAIRVADELFVGRVIGRGIYDRINRAATEQIQKPDRSDFIRRQISIVARVPPNIVGLPWTNEQKQAHDDSSWYFEKWIGDNPDATNDEIRREALAVVNDREKYAAQERLTYLPLPKFSGVQNPLAINYEILEESRKRTAAALEAKQISQQEAIRESNLIKQWADTLAIIAPPETAGGGRVSPNKSLKRSEGATR